MALKVPHTFPSDSSEKEIREIIKECAWQLSHHTEDVYSSEGPDLWTQVMQIGHNELANRNQERFKRSTTRLTLITIILAVTTSVLAAATLWFAFGDSRLDKQWKERQIELLEKQILLLEEGYPYYKKPNIDSTMIAPSQAESLN